MTTGSEGATSGKIDDSGESLKAIYFRPPSRNSYSPATTEQSLSSSSSTASLGTCSPSSPTQACKKLSETDRLLKIIDQLKMEKQCLVDSVINLSKQCDEDRRYFKIEREKVMSELTANKTRCKHYEKTCRSLETNITEILRSEINEDGLPVVYDGVGKVTMEKSLGCLKMRGTFVSFGNASGKLDPLDVGKLIAPKGLFLTRPSIAHYTATREELDEAANKLFEMVQQEKVKIDIFKKYSLNDVINAHRDLEARKIIGPAIIVPN